MPDRTNVKQPEHKNVIYLYDGTFEGLLCCMFESFARKELPAGILTEDSSQIPLAPTKMIETNLEKARRVYASVPKKISPAAKEFLEQSYLTCHPDKEMLMLDFLHQGFRYGGRVMDRLTDDTVNALFKAVKHLTHEAHLLTGFIRFSIHNGILVSVIGPENFVIPLIREHFCDRYPNESFMIYDCTHGMALVHKPGQSGVIPVDEFTMAEPDEEEQAYQRLWKLFYDTIAVEGRINPRCRMSHMPKRYWQYMTEFQQPGKDVRRVADGGKGILLP